MSQFTDLAAREVLAGLRAALDPDPERAGKKYVLLRRKLVSFFEWSGATAPESTADEALTAVAWTLTDGGPGQNIPVMCLATARIILSKQAGTTEIAPAPPQPAALETSPAPPAVAEPADLVAPSAPPVDVQPPAPVVAAKPAEPEPPAKEDLEPLLHAFEEGLDALAPDSRDLLLTYYAGEHPQAIEARQALAKRLGLPMYQLRFHAHRTRVQLEQSVMGGVN